jgi:hypothetical protein
MSVQSSSPITVPNAGTPSRLIDHIRERAAIIYLEGIYDPRRPVPTPSWTAENLALGGGITTSRVTSSHRVTLSTIVLVDPLIYTRVMHLKPSLEFCREDKPGSYKLCHPDTEEGQNGQWMPLVELPQHWRNIPGGPSLQAIWHVVSNVSPLEPHTIEYLNGDRFDLRLANLSLGEGALS